MRDQPRADPVPAHHRRRLAAVRSRRPDRSGGHRVLAAVHDAADGRGVGPDERAEHDDVRLRLRADFRLDVRRLGAVHRLRRHRRDGGAGHDPAAGRRAAQARAGTRGARFRAGRDVPHGPRRVTVHIGADPPVRRGRGVLLRADRHVPGGARAHRRRLPRAGPQAVVRQRDRHVDRADAVHDQPLRRDAGAAAGAERRVPAGAVRAGTGAARPADPAAAAVPRAATACGTARAAAACARSALPAARQRCALGVPGRGLDAHDGLRVEVLQRGRAGVRARRAQARADRVEQVLDARGGRVQPHP